MPNDTTGTDYAPIGVGRMMFAQDVREVDAHLRDMFEDFARLRCPVTVMERTAAALEGSASMIAQTVQTQLAVGERENREVVPSQVQEKAVSPNDRAFLSAAYARDVARIVSRPDTVHVRVGTRTRMSVAHELAAYRTDGTRMTDFVPHYFLERREIADYSAGDLDAR